VAVPKPLPLACSLASDIAASHHTMLRQLIPSLADQNLFVGQHPSQSTGRGHLAWVPVNGIWYKSRLPREA
jgi:hypothetical protein